MEEGKVIMQKKAYLCISALCDRRKLDFKHFFVWYYFNEPVTNTYSSNNTTEGLVFLNHWCLMK